MPTRIEVSPAVLGWATTRSGLPEDKLVRRFPSLPLWRRGERYPTVKQAQDFASYTHVPFGALLLTQPPVEELPVPDYRVRGGVVVDQPSADLLDTIYICQRRQDWFREYATAVGLDPLDFAGSADVDRDPEAVANEIRKRLGFDLEARRTFPTWEQALRELLDRVEDLGVLVMVNGVVGSNTHRKLDPDEFGGFALVDDLAPLIFINGADTKAAQIFTLAHELAHIWLGESAVSSSVLRDVEIEERAERWCNAVAGELLVPVDSLRREYGGDGPLIEEAQRLARLYKVSTLVALRRLFDADLLGWDNYRAAYGQELERLRNLGRPKQAGGNFYNTQPLRSSHRFARALIRDTLEGRTLYRDAYRLLGIRKPETFDTLREHLGVG